MRCPNCGAIAREYERHCSACSCDLGFPNVRAAQKPEEQGALEDRYKRAESAATAKGSSTVLADFCRAVGYSQAVICRSISQIHELVSSGNQLYATFYQLVAAGARRPEDSAVESLRRVADNLLFPHYHDEIRFAALSLDGSGATSYGRYSLVIRDVAIRERATVFEENSVEFFKKRKLAFGARVPLGYRATWNQRGILAAAKLEGTLKPGTKPQEFAEVLLKPPAKPSREDFIEVHIYGSLSRESYERVVGDAPARSADKVILRRVEELLRASRS